MRAIFTTRSFGFNGLFISKSRASRFCAVAIPMMAAALMLKGDLPDPTSNRWASTPGRMNAGRSNACAVPLADGRVLLAGGANASGALASAEILDQNGRVSPPASMLSAHDGAVCALLPDGTAMVAGGRTSAGVSNAVEIYDPAADGWRPGPSLTEGRSGATLSKLPDGRM